MSEEPKPVQKPFLARWSEKKRTAETQEEVDLPEAEPAATEDRLHGLSEAEILEELGLPEPDSLNPGDDFSVFMQSAVPQHLRTRALRKLWGTNPVLANVDGLVDYGGDFTDAATVIPDMKTLYEVGKGIFHPKEDVEPQEDLAVTEDVEHLETAKIDENAGEIEPEDSSDDAAHQEMREELHVAEAQPEEPAPRRMTFQFRDAK